MRDAIIALPLALLTAVCGLAALVAEGCAKLAEGLEDLGTRLCDWADDA